VVEQEPETPPENADEWTDEQWIDWLKATDGGGEPPEVTHPHRVSHSVGGQVVGNAMVGLANALYGSRDEKPAIVVEAGEPDAEDSLELHLDFDHPEQSFVIRRSDSEPPE
jgi:hypothetical protein